MRNLAINFPLVGKISFRKIDYSSTSRLLAYANQKFAYIYILALPFLVFLLKDESLETSLFFGSLFIVTPLITIFLVRLSLFGSNVFVDPKGFITVLTFALLTTTASISIDSPSKTNTFGQDGIRGLSGIMIMAFITLYYCINVVIRDKNLFKRYFSAFLFSNILFGYLAIFNSFKFEYGIILISGIPFVYALANTYKRLKPFIYIYILSLLGLLVFTANMFSLEVGKYPFELLILATLLSFLTIAYLLLSNSNQKLKRKDNWFTRLMHLNSEKDLTITSSLILNSIPVVFLTVLSLYFLYSLFDTSSFNDFIKNTFDNYSNGFKYLTDSKFKGIDLVQNLAFGLGSDQISENTSLFSSVLVSQGFFGIAAYIILLSYALVNATKLVVHAYLKNSYFYFNASLLFNLVFISILSVFVYPGIYLLILWWISFSMLMAYDSFKATKEEKLYLEGDFTIGSDKSKLKLYLRILSSVFIVILSISLIYQLVISIGEV